ncbi:phage tail protein [Methylibium sp.]|uniref:phage tail protein n=1 Tax=Methylibium sp. TaxID=2067992 RepID=UPI001841E8AA|nr:phage tail protein [Methylibium sp.]MBA3588309.1 hypothetical protein [Methylibium sp.]
MSEQSLLQIAGTVVGYYFGGPVGGAIGGAIGGAVGASLVNLPTQFGPRLADRSVQVSSFGAAVPYLFGEGRTSGNVIWVKDNALEEVEESSEVGGKGSPSQTVVSYSYYATFALLLGFGRLRGVRRIWGDAVLIFDGSTEGAPNDLDFVFYPGNDTQLPDPTLEAALGVGNAPAYRGYAYLMFNRMPLGIFGNRIPNITVEYVAEGDFQATATDLGTASAMRFDGAVQRLDGRVVAFGEPVAGTSRLQVLNPDTGAVELTVDHALDLNSNSVFLHAGAACFVPPTNEVWIDFGGDIERFDAATLANVGRIELPWSATVMAYSPAQRRVFVHSASIAIGSYARYDPNGTTAEGGGFFTGMFFCRELVTGGSTVVVGTNGLGGFGVLRMDLQTGISNVLADQSTPSSSSLGCWDSVRRRYVVAGASGSAGAVWAVSDADPPVITPYLPAGMFAHSSPRAVQYLPGLDAIAVYSTVAGILLVTLLDAETMTVLLEQSNVSTAGVSGVLASPSDAGGVFVLGNFQPYDLLLHASTYGGAVRRIATESGELADADLNVSALTQRLRGYVIGQQARAREAIEQLLQPVLADCCEEDDLLVFRRRGGASVASIAAADCGAGFDAAAEESITWVRAEEANLPSVVTVTAPDPARDYQADAQYAPRLVRQAGEPQSVQLGVVLTADEQIRLAHALLFQGWIERERVTWSTTRSYSRLVPTDVVTLAGRRVRITARDDQDGVINWQGVADDADVVTQTLNAVVGAFPRQTLNVVVPTVWGLLDMPLLRDADNAPGAYVWFYGAASWRGGVLLSSNDDGANFERKATLPRPGSGVGAATGALGNWSGGNVFDNANRVNVAFANGAPQSYTRDSLLAGNGYFAIESLVGAQTVWEVCQARTATLEADGTYTLSGLLRGRRGTEHTMAGHAIGDRVVLLGATTIRTLAIESAQIGSELDYRAVSIGDTLENTANEELTITAERLRPFAPVDLRALRDVASGDIALSWGRRTRLSHRFLAAGVAVPLGEDSEAWVVKVWDASYTTLKRTIAATTASAAYSAAQQTTDFGSTQATVYLTVTQTSAAVGAGHELRDAA